MFVAPHLQAQLTHQGTCLSWETPVLLSLCCDGDSFLAVLLYPHIAQHY
jgi:hypothetical protein